MISKLPDFQSPLLDSLNAQQHILNSMKNQLSLSSTRISEIAQFAEDTSLKAHYPGMFRALDIMASLSLQNTIQTLSTPYMSDVLAKLNVTLQNPVATSIQNLIHTHSAVAQAFSSPLMDWLRNYDFSISLRSISQVLESVARYSIPVKKFERICLHALYQTKWFPHVVNVADQTLIFSICGILDTSRGFSKRCEKRIDAAILTYFTKAKVRELKRGWYYSDLDQPIKRVMCQAIEAYLRGEYALTISSLSTLWEGLIYTKAHNVTMAERQRQGMSKTREDLSTLTQLNDFDTVYSEFFEKFIVSQCEGIDDILEGVPNRHGVAHSWYKKYPNKKAALNAILLTDFLVTLNPCVEMQQAS